MPESVVITLLGGFSRLPHNVQAHVLKWLVIVYDTMESHAALHRLYTVLFHFLDYDQLRPLICQLLARLTRREDVKPFRIRKLAQLTERVGECKFVIALQRVYKEFYPNLVHLSSKRERRFVWKVPDKELQARIHAVQKLQKADLAKEDVPFQTTSQLAIATESLAHHLSAASRARAEASQMRAERSAAATRGRKRAAEPTAFVPSTLSTSSRLTNMAPKRTRVALTEITSVAELVTALDKIVLPDQMAAVLDSRLLQHIVSLQADRTHLMRISNWLGFRLQAEFSMADRSWSGADGPPPVVRSLMTGLVKFTAFIQEVEPGVEAFLCRYLASWNGVTFLDEILFLVSYMRPRSFDDIFNDVLVPLHRVLLTSPTVTQAKVINCLTAMLRRWATHDWKTFYEAHAKAAGNEKATIWCMDRYLFQPLPARVDHYRCIHEFCQYANRLCTLALHRSGDNFVVQHAVLAFYELTSTLHVDYGLPFVETPSQYVVYRALLSSTPMAISRMCGVMANYKASFDSIKAAEPTSLNFPNGQSSITAFNAFISDFCSALWRNKAFQDYVGGGTTVATNLPLPDNARDELGYGDFGSILSLTHSAAFAMLGRKFLEENEDLKDHAASKDTDTIPRKLRDSQSVRKRFVHFLRDNGYTGLMHFLSAFVRVFKPQT